MLFIMILANLSHSSLSSYLKSDETSSCCLYIFLFLLCVCVCVCVRERERERKKEREDPLSLFIFPLNFQMYILTGLYHELLDSGDDYTVHGLHELEHRGWLKLLVIIQ